MSSCIDRLENIVSKHREISKILPRKYIDMLYSSITILKTCSIPRDYRPIIESICNQVVKQLMSVNTTRSKDLHKSISLLYRYTNNVKALSNGTVGRVIWIRRLILISLTILIPFIGVLYDVVTALILGIALLLSIYEFYKYRHTSLIAMYILGLGVTIMSLLIVINTIIAIIRGSMSTTNISIVLIGIAGIALLNYSLKSLYRFRNIFI